MRRINRNMGVLRSTHRKMIEKKEYDFSYRIENDMWSVGIIAFTLLSGMAPFDG